MATQFMSDRPSVVPDSLSAILPKLGLKAEVFMQADLCGLWAIDTSGQRKVPFHLVEEGAGWLHTPGLDAAPRLLRKGDFVVFPHDAPHCISSDPQPPAPEIINRIPHLGDGPVTSLVCGFYGFRNRDAWPLLDSLPSAVVLNASDEQGAAFPLLKLMMAERGKAKPGRAAVLNALAYLLFIKVLRTQIESGVSMGLLLALADRQIGPVLNLLHADFRRDWTVVELAESAGMSRSAFSDRFVSLVGKAPMRYLAEWRMREAADMLATSGASVATIAENVGYESEVAFRKAFRRITGQTPGKLRRA